MLRIIENYKKYKKFCLKAEGQSMRPIIFAGDVIYFKHVSFHNIKVNDIILLKKNRQFYIHRIIYKSNNYLISKGDNNSLSDGKIYPHRVIGLVYQLKRNGQIFHPDDLYLLQSTQYFQEIVRIKKAFEKEKIDFVFLKGLPLHLYFEKSHPGRIYADCDVLISKSQSNKVKKILERLGYQSINSSLSEMHSKLREKQIEQSYFNNINDFPVIFDVHLEIDWMSPQLGRLEAFYPQRFINQLTKEFLETKKSVTIQNEKFLILNSEFLILYLSLHFFHHNFRGAFRLEFLNKVIRKSLQVPSPSGEPLRVTPEVFLTLSDKIVNFRLQNFVYPVFLLLKKYYHTPLPKYFLNTIKPEPSIINYIHNNIVRVRPSARLRSDPINIFDDETRIRAGINRFKNLFFLSPNPLWRKLMIIFNIQVIYSVFWVMIFLLRSSFRRSDRSS